MRIKNINGTKDNICNCGSWLDHWEKFSGQPLSYCAVSGCNNLAEVGAHVQIDNPYNNNWYIVPLCQEHNKSKMILVISDSIVPVSANVSETCGKKSTW